MTLVTGNDRQRIVGFTLIELSIAVFIVAMIMAVAAPSFVRSYNSAVLNETARAFGTTCLFARIEAVTRQKVAKLHIDLERQMFWVAQNLPTEEGGAEGQTTKVYQVPQRVALVSAELVDGPPKQEKQVEVTFYPNGTCDAVTVVFRGGDERQGLALNIDPLTAQATTYPVKL
jgi:prepilin-type N-terminal cleavage/methylation domain-containing protein